MIAILVHQYGGPDELKVDDVDVPSPADGEALIRVCAAGVGPWDALVRTGHSGLPQTLPLIPGSDIAGVVEQIKTDSAPAALKRGDAVFGVTNPKFTGGYAQYAVASLTSIARKPETLSFVEAASVPVVAVTAWQMLFDYAKLDRGQRVLVHGAAGNVGAYAVQLARWAGAEVIAVARSVDAGYLRSIGATQVIDFTTQRFEDCVANVDAVIDTIGGETQARSFGVLKRDGILVSSVSQPSQTDAVRYGVRTAYFIVSVTAAQLERITQLFDEGVLKTDLGVVLSFTDARKAHEMLAGSLPHPRGKIVLDVNLTKETP